MHRCVREVCSYIRTLATAPQQKIIINFPRGGIFLASAAVNLFILNVFAASQT